MKIKCNIWLISHASHTLHREEGSGHTATIELSPQQKLDATNQICSYCRSHPLLSLRHMFSRCQHLITCIYCHNHVCSIIAFLGDNLRLTVWPDPSSLWRVWLARLTWHNSLLSKKPGWRLHLQYFCTAGFLSLKVRPPQFVFLFQVLCSHPSVPF